MVFVMHVRTKIKKKIDWDLVKKELSELCERFRKKW